MRREVLGKQPVCIAVSVVAGLLIGSMAKADVNQSLSASSGVAVVSVFSDAYKVERTNVVVGSLRYTKQLTPRWSGTGLYVNCLGGMLSGYNLGIIYDSKSVNQVTGDMTGSGVREIESVPKWLLRASLSGGVWQYLSPLTKTNPRPGEDLKAPVSAVLYGVTLGGQVQRFLDQNKALGLEIMNVSTFAQSFSVNGLIITFGFNAYY